jgi:BNR repeat-like domain/Domain of Unknown Function (DUF1080)
MSRLDLSKSAAAIFAAILFCVVPQIVAGPVGPVSWNGTVSLGGGWGRMVHLTNGNWLCVTTQFPVGTNSYLRISRSTDNCRTWITLANVKEARTLDNGELIQVPDGTVLLTMRSLIPNNSYELHVYASADNGTTWVYRSNIDTSSGTTAVQGKGLWEPDFWVLDDGRLVVTYANETHSGYSQVVSERVSTDNGVTWGAESFAAAQVGGGSLRPGMPQMVRMSNGKYFLVFEVVNSGNADVYGKTSDDGVTWPAGIGTKIPCQHCGPFVMSLPNGVLLVTSCENQMSFSEDYGATWQLNDPPGWPANYEFTWPAIYLTQTNEVGLMIVTNNVRLHFGSVSPRPLWTNPFVTDFNGGTDPGWAHYGGNFSFNAGAYLLNNVGTNGKAMAGDGFWTDGTLDADVMLNSTGNAGVMFRTTNPDYTGPDDAMGYYAGLDAGGFAVLGRESNSWTQLTTAAMSVPTNVWHHLRVNLQGGAMKIYVNDLVTPKISWTDTNFNRGQIGVRAFQCNAQFDNVTFSNAVPLQLSLSQAGNQFQFSWPQTSVSVRLVAQTNLTMMASGNIQTNLPLLTNGNWQVQLNPLLDPAEFFWLRSE